MNPKKNQTTFLQPSGLLPFLVKLGVLNPNVGNEVIGVSTTQPFTISYSPKKSGQCTLSVSFDLSSKDHNKWVEVESIVEVIGAE